MLFECMCNNILIKKIPHLTMEEKGITAIITAIEKYPLKIQTKGTFAKNFTSRKYNYNNIKLNHTQSKKHLDKEIQQLQDEENINNYARGSTY